MIIYHELSSLQNDLGISIKSLYSISNSIDKHYRKTILQKGNGEERILYVPSDSLKLIQQKINEVMLSRMEVSPFATAYRFGYGPAVNAAAHIGQPVLLKLDIRHFFDRIIYPSVKECAFPVSVYSEPIRILLAMLCTYRGTLPQGAPSSPAISNLILKEFDNTIGPWCKSRGITYTRYCDDMTFSGSFNPREVITLVKDELGHYGFFINEKKTKVIQSGQCKSVTGFVVNEKLNVSAEYRRRIRQEMHYCMQYGITSHLEHIGIETAPIKYVMSLLGRVNYVLTANVHNKEFQNYRNWLTNTAKSLPTDISCEQTVPISIDSNSAVSVPYFGKVDISECPVNLVLDEMEGNLFPDQKTLEQFVRNNFYTFRESGKNYAVCRGDNSLSAVILITDGILRASFYQSAKRLLCGNANYWYTISTRTLGNDIRNHFPPFFTDILDLFKQYGLVYTNVIHGDKGPAAVVIPNYEKLISGWLPRSCRKEILQRGIGLLAGEKNGMILECLYGVELFLGERSLGRITNYKNGAFTVERNNGRKTTIPIAKFKEFDYDDFSASAEWNPNFESIFYDCLDAIDDLENQVEYDRIGIGQENDGLVMRNGGFTGLFFKMK